MAESPIRARTRDEIDDEKPLLREFEDAFLLLLRANVRPTIAHANERPTLTTTTRTGLLRDKGRVTFVRDRFLDVVDVRGGRIVLEHR